MSFPHGKNSIPHVFPILDGQTSHVLTPQVSADHRVDGRRGWASTIAGPLDGARASEISEMCEKSWGLLYDFSMGTYNIVIRHYYTSYNYSYISYTGTI